MTIQSQKDTVREFCSAWENLDVGKIMSLMTDDAVYHNMPIAPLKGQQQISEFVGGFLDMCSSCTFDILNIVADEHRVVTERVDTFGMKDGSTIDALPVLGIFEFDDNGKICAWREYWDLQDWIARGGPAL
ncbi:MAG: limonene-1,2-epoxide hydrolase [Piscirickettsiaceae bacterium]|nr:MAG: limonene-1,2-epoxide hydrolase [Piscirickettsiaceae bacterium]